jgi:5-methylcytosine-specific restriction endonuclease McrA
MARRYTPELLAEAARHAESVAGVLRYLGLNQAGGTHAHVSRMLKEFNIDTGHFCRNKYYGGGLPRLTPAQILVRILPGSKRTRPQLLRRALLEIGRAYACAICKNTGMWQARPLVLEVDHIDGDFHNNEEWNLRFLCPNCHAQTDNFSGKSRGKYESVTGQQLALFGRLRPDNASASTLRNVSGRGPRL